ncbi:hypothetical protein Pfo_028268 [Paulownia fortunei]|nr:hypothetical protein Pfo_028268 [Paulownia fortunei]
MATNYHSSHNHHHHYLNHRDPNVSMSTRVVVVMVPLPAQGHLNQLLQLSRLIAAYDVPVHYVCTATHNHQAKLRVRGWDPLATANVHFHEFPIPEFQSPSFNPNAANKFPSHLQPLFNAASHLRQPLTAPSQPAPPPLPPHLRPRCGGPLCWHHHHNRQARRRIQGWDPLSISNIIFHEFPSLSFQSPPPDPNASIQFPSHLQPLFDASSSLRQPVGDLLRHLCAASRRVVIIYDSLMGSVVQDFVKFPNAEAYTFHSVSAYTIFFFLWENMGRPFTIDAEILENLPSLEGCFTSEFGKFVGRQHEYMKLNSGRIYNTCRVVESLFLELLEKPEISGNKKQWALGPFNPVNTESGERKKGSSSDSHIYNTCRLMEAPFLDILESEEVAGNRKSWAIGPLLPAKLSSAKNFESQHECLKWLDKQEPRSVIYVTFGTTTSLTDDEIKELATGLEQSKQKFIWVLRDADKANVFDGEVRRAELPPGFEERVEGMGMVVRDWAPQPEILAHPSTGGFMSHCGWNSCIESITMGVPIAAWPMHSDQPTNAVLVTEILKVGLAVREWTHSGEIVKASTVENVVKRLMDSEEGDEIRKRAEDLAAIVRQATEEGGASRLELDSFIAHITR